VASNKAGHDLKRLLRPWSIAGTVLVLLTLFGGLVEAGVVMPKFTVPGTGSEGSTYSNIIENSSWRSWTITAIRLADGQRSSKLGDGSTVRLGDLYPGEVPPGNSPPIVAMPYELGAGQSVTLTLVRAHVSKCKNPPLQTSRQLQRFQADIAKDLVDIPVEVSVATPLGTRDVPVDFDFSFGCP
jgi:hypothetical protein